ncbi:SDR family oxidoreductase [uncultured Megasphaera sp.]|uniref:SDR family NAD(P)-dependent oxidoreductase n=1 Tax=uncultured Megasphaera sp. TaxID=165188 RepID=UPI002638687D|nr:SDR family NAD(P)-dependent oxidoreductase [uncultured Megasphaera sp.]
MEIAIVTGASSGLGQEYAKLLDQEGVDEIWLVARRRPQLETLAGELTTKSRIYALDLTDRASLLTLQQALAACQVTVRYLIHAAGFGKMGPVAAVPAGVLENMIDLNDRAAVSLVQAVLPYCHAGSHLVQICSCAAFLPIPELAVYAATKAFLLRYSRALAVELAPQGILVSAVCPYWVKDTGFIATASQTDEGRLFRHFPLAGTKEAIARRSFQAVKKGRVVITPDVVSTLLRFLSGWIPQSILLYGSRWFR